MSPATAQAAAVEHHDRAALIELAPVLRRAAELDARSLVRLRIGAATTGALVRLPFDVLVARTVAIGSDQRPQRDATVGVVEVLAWLDDDGNPDPPTRRDLEWRGSVPPATGWRRVDSVPDTVVRELVRSGATAVADAAAREGVPGASLRAEAATALLDSVVLTVTDNPDSDQTEVGTEITLRSLSALTRMGFLPRGSHIAVDVAGRWTRIAAAYGSVYAERAGLGLGTLSR